MMSVGGGTYLRVVAEQLYFDAERETQNVFHAQTAVGCFTDQIQFARTHFVEERDRTEQVMFRTECNSLSDENIRTQFGAEFVVTVRITSGFFLPEIFSGYRCHI